MLLKDSNHPNWKISLNMAQKTQLGCLCFQFGGSNLLFESKPNYCAKSVSFLFWLLSLVCTKRLLNCQASVLGSKPCRMLRTLLVCLLFCYWFKVKSSLLCHEPGGKPAEVSRRGDGNSTLLFITKLGQNTACFCVSQIWWENQLKVGNHICQGTWHLFALCNRPFIFCVEEHS